MSDRPQRPQERPPADLGPRVPGTGWRVPWGLPDPSPGPQDWAPTAPGTPASVIADLPVAPCKRRDPHAPHDHTPIPSLHCPGVPSARTSERLNDVESLAALLASLDRADDRYVARIILDYLRTGIM